MQVVLDTSVIVAGTRSNAGASHQLLKAALERQFVMLLSVPLALEYEAVLKRPKQLKATGGTIQQIDSLLDALIAVSRPVYRAFFWRPLLRDANDDMVLEVALNGRADMLVTFDRKDFEPVASSLAIDVMTPQAALQKIRRKDEEE